MMQTVIIGIGATLVYLGFAAFIGTPYAFAAEFLGGLMLGAAVYEMFRR